MNITKTKCTVFNERYFQNIDTPQKAYMLGLLLSDGTIRKNNSISLSQCLENIDIINFFAEELKFNGYYLLNSKVIKGVKKYYPCINFSSKKMTSDLKNFGIIPSKTWTLRIPKVDYMSYMILGIFDGDGCIHYKNGKKNTVFQLSGTKNSMLDLYTYFIEIGIEVKYRKHNAKGNCYIIYCYKKKEIKKIYDLFYQNPNIGLKRKKSIFENIINDYDLDESSETRFEYNIDNRHIYNSYIIGTILGNGNFLSNTRIKINKGSFDNLGFKKELFKKYIQPTTENIVNNKIYSVTYRSKKFQYIFKEMDNRLSQEIINRINEYSLGILYLDKGKIIDEKIIISNLKYPKHDNERICAHVKNKYKIKMIHKNNSFVLDQDNSTKFLNLIKEIIILHSNYKTSETSFKEVMI